MIYVDYRAGSNTLGESLSKAGLPTTEGQNPGDVDLYFDGRGPKGAGITISMEHKKLDDAISSIRNNRIFEQCRKAVAAHFTFRYLLIEGERICGNDGTLLRRVGRQEFRPYPGSMTYGEMVKHLVDLQHAYGMFCWWVETRRDAISYISSLYRFYTDKDLDQHSSATAVHQPATLMPLNDFQRGIRILPEVGPAVAKAAEWKFKSLHRAFNASAREWADIHTTDRKGNTRRFGESHAESIITFLRREHGHSKAK